jgi:type II secretory pathway pseudopilin PulG
MAATVRRTRVSEGFTLVEVLVMAGLLAFILLGAASLFMFAVKQNAWGKDETVLVSLAQRKMEEVRGLSANKLDKDVWQSSQPDLPVNDPGSVGVCLADPSPSERETWPVVGEDAVHWDLTEFSDADKIHEQQYRWNYCVYEVVFGECVPDTSTCGPDTVGAYIDAKKIVVEVCKREATDLERQRGRAEHCAKLEMYR